MKYGSYEDIYTVTDVEENCKKHKPAGTVNLKQVIQSSLFVMFHGNSIHKIARNLLAMDLCMTVTVFFF
jgi:hypothetical protein